MDAFSGILQWFKDSYGNGKFKTVVMGGYDKAVREIRSHFKDGKQPEVPVLPAISLNPLGDISMDPRFMQLWRVPSIGSDLAGLYLNDLIYEDRNFGFALIHNRFIGNFEVIIYCQSAYEYMDFFTQTLLWFHNGGGRVVRPGLIKTNCILPEEIVKGAYENEDWASSGLTRKFIRQMNENGFIYPVVIAPQIKLSSVSNASTVYGDSDVSEYKLQITVEYDIDLPTHILVRNDAMPMIQDLVIRTNDSEMVYHHVYTPEDKTVADIEEEWYKRSYNSYYFARLEKDEYFNLIYDYESLAKFTSRPDDYVQVMAMEYKFPKDCDPETIPYIIDLSVIPYEIESYDEIVIGSRSPDEEEGYGIIKAGDAYTVDFGQTYKQISPKYKIKKDTVWDIVIYKKKDPSTGDKPKAYKRRGGKKKKEDPSITNVEPTINNML